MREAKSRSSTSSPAGRAASSAVRAASQPVGAGASPPPTSKVSVRSVAWRAAQRQNQLHLSAPKSRPPGVIISGKGTHLRRGVAGRGELGTVHAQQQAGWPAGSLLHLAAA